MRRRLSEELGFLISPVRIRDDLDLPASGYRVSLLGSPVAQGEVYIDKELAINPGHIEEPIKGIATRDPAFNLEAVWIDPAQREDAQGRGYTVVDVPTVIATHLSKLLQENAHELLGHQETHALMEKAARTHPKLVEELTPRSLTLGEIQKVLQNLLRERVSIRDMVSIGEALADAATVTKDPVQPRGCRSLGESPGSVP